MGLVGLLVLLLLLRLLNLEHLHLSHVLEVELLNLCGRNGKTSDTSVRSPRKTNTVLYCTARLVLYRRTIIFNLAYEETPHALLGFRENRRTNAQKNTRGREGKVASPSFSTSALFKRSATYVIKTPRFL